MEDEIKLKIREELAIARKRLKAARLLLKNDMLEDSSNRIYYSVFFAAKAVLNSLGHDAKTHSGLLTQFGLRVVKEKLMPDKYGQTLRKTLELRESSDYEVGIVLEKKEITDLLRDAEDFLAKAEKFVKERL